MLCVSVMTDKGRKLELALGVSIWRRRHMPNLDLSAQGRHKVSSRRGEGEGCYRPPEGEVVEYNTPWYAGQDRLAIFVNREQKVALGRQAYPGDIFSVGKGEGVRLVAAQ